MLVALPSCQADLYEGITSIQSLNNDTIDRVLVKSNRCWMVQFYSSWCGHCQSFAPTYIGLAEDVAGNLSILDDISSIQAMPSFLDLPSFPNALPIHFFFHFIISIDQVYPRLYVAFVVYSKLLCPSFYSTVLTCKSLQVQSYNHVSNDVLQLAIQGYLFLYHSFR